MNNFIDGAGLTAISTVVASVITYLVTKSTNKKDINISDRVQLSKDQQALMDKFRDLLDEQKIEIDKLKLEVNKLREMNIELIAENKFLRRKQTVKIKGE